MRGALVLLGAVIFAAAAAAASGSPSGTYSATITGAKLVGRKLVLTTKPFLK
ncbi:MAG: hypothetical protein ACXVZ3_16055 [Gaiellaceae bacterium]